jgi:iron complex transport system permease protein
MTAEAIGIARPGSRRFARAAIWIFLTVALVAAAILSLGLGRYPVSPDRVVAILLSNVMPITPDWSDIEGRVVELIRLPRVALAILCGAGLGIAGASLQGVFRNPLVGPEVIGVSAGASFGGALALMLAASGAVLVGSAFLFGLVALAGVYLISRRDGRSNIVTLILAGVVASSFFTALVSLLKYVADPFERLPAIVYWLLGSLATATPNKLAIAVLPIVVPALLLYAMRYRINLLSLGDEEAQALGVPVERTRWTLLAAATLITAATVAVAGVIGWVGLVVPHFARMLVGPDHRVLLPASGLIGGLFLLLVDDVARSASAAEIPLGVLTALVGAPVFAWLLKRLQTKGWRSDGA